MKKILIITALSLPLGVFAQGNNVNPQVQNMPHGNQLQNTNYYDNINDNNNPIQANISNQQANPPIQQSFFGSGTNDNTNGKVRCKDCEAVKAALKAVHHSPAGIHKRSPWRIKKRLKKIPGKINLRMQKIFSHKKKVRTTYETCFKWH